MKSLYVFLLAALTTLSAEARQFSPEQVEKLDCTATNLLGVSTFVLKDGEMHSRTNGTFAPYSLSGLGSNDQLNFAYVNLVSGWGRTYVSFVFPAQRFIPGEPQVLNGVLYLNVAVNPFAPSTNFGTPWANVSCRSELRGR